MSGAKKEISRSAALAQKQLLIPFLIGRMPASEMERSGIERTAKPGVHRAAGLARAAVSLGIWRAKRAPGNCVFRGSARMRNDASEMKRSGIGRARETMFSGALPEADMT